MAKGRGEDVGRTSIVASNGSLVGSDAERGTSTQFTDGEEDEEDEEEEGVEGGEWVADVPLPASPVNLHSEVMTFGLANGACDLALPSTDPSTFGDVCVKNSSNVHLGNKTFYKGPVTIKQFVYANPTSIQTQDHPEATLGTCEGLGADVTYRVSSANASDLSTSKSDGSPTRPILIRDPEYYKVTQWLWTWRCAAISCVLGLILVTTIVVSSVLLTRPTAPVFPKIPDSSITGIVPSKVRFVSRVEWGAQPPAEPLTPLKLPVPYVIISHTANEFCYTQSSCTFHVRFAQTFHIESRNWSDIAYNFLVGGDGLAYVGRGWDYMGAHAFGFNNVSIGISFIGTFNTVVPPNAQLEVAKKLIEFGVKGGKIAENYTLLGHRQVSRTLSPGDALYSIIRNWPHWELKP